MPGWQRSKAQHYECELEGGTTMKAHIADVDFEEWLGAPYLQRKGRKPAKLAGHSQTLMRVKRLRVVGTETWRTPKQWVRKLEQDRRREETTR